MIQYLLQLSINNNYHLGIVILLQIFFYLVAIRLLFISGDIFAFCFYPNPKLLCKIFAEYFQWFLDVFSVDLHDFGALLKEIFLPIIKMAVIKRGHNLVIFYQVLYYNLFLELEQPFWIHLRDQNRRLGFAGHIFLHRVVSESFSSFLYCVFNYAFSDSDK